MTVSALRKRTLMACSEAMKEIGFRSTRERDEFTLDRGEGIYGVVGLNVSNSGLPEVFEVNPVIGVVYQRIEQLLRECSVEPFSAGSIPVVSRSLGYLMPNESFRTWEFYADADLGGPAKDIAAAVARYGLPFIERFGNWSIFSAEIESCGLVHEHMRLKIFPIVRAISGDVSYARNMVEDELNRIRNNDDSYAMSYKHFADEFRRRVVKPNE